MTHYNYSHLSPKQLCSLVYRHSGLRALVLIWCVVIRKKAKKLTKFRPSRPKCP